MRVAALDLGSNTSLLLVAEMNGSELVRVLHDETTITKMGQGVHANRRLHPEALQRLDECLASYAQRIQKLKVDKVIAVATSAARDVQNGELLLQLGHKHGVPIHIISGEREAQLTFIGALCDRPDRRGLGVIDVGGGSTEIIASSDGLKAEGTSVNVGSVRLTELFIQRHPVAPAAMVEVQKYAERAFQEAKIERLKGEAVAVAGTPTTLAALDLGRPFAEELVHGYKLSLQVIDEWTKRLAQMTVAQREALPGMQPKRADVIVAGALILAQAIRALGKTEVTVSTRGVRYGVALQWQSF